MSVMSAIGFFMVGPFYHRLETRNSSETNVDKQGLARVIMLPQFSTCTKDYGHLAMAVFLQFYVLHW